MYTQKEYVKQMIKVIEANLGGGSLPNYSLKLNIRKDNNYFLFRYMMPYEAIKLEGGKILFLNRGYRPIFFADDGHSNYVDYGEFENIAFESDKESMYFYTDSSKIWESKANLKMYIEKLKDFLDI